MIFVQWAAPSRVLPGAEVDSAFESDDTEMQLYAFTTDRLVVGEHGGHLSVKMVTRGAERYRIGNRTVVLEPGQILIVNEGQEYSSRVDRRGTHSISLFVPPCRVGEFGLPPKRHAGIGLDRPPQSGAPAVWQVPFRPQPALTRAMGHLTNATRTRAPDAHRLEELTVETTALAMRDALALPPPDALARYVRRSTREELLTRVLRTRDLIHDSGGLATLDRLARTACLSKFHFLRVFREVFGRTPAQYARRVRLTRGVERLRRGGSSITAARAAGFSSPSAFFRALRRAGMGR